MTPDLGQGACQAIEDAVVLAACLEQEADPATALRRYESIRQPRTAEIVKMAARMGDMAQWQNPLAAGLRDLLNASLPQAVILNQVAKLWHFPARRRPAPRISRRRGRKAAAAGRARPRRRSRRAAGSGRRWRRRRRSGSPGGRR